MGNKATPRRAIIIGLGVALLVLFLTLATLNAFNLNFLDPASPIQTLVFIALSTIAFLLFVGVLVLLVRNVLKLYADQRSRVLGTRLRTRMVWGAVLVSLVPLVFMFAFSYLLMNRAQERWFSQPVAQMRQDSNDMAAELDRYIGANARAEADSIAIGLSENSGAISSATATRELYRHEATLQGGFSLIYRDNQPLASLHVPLDSTQAGAVKPMLPEYNTSDEDSVARPLQTIPLSGKVQNAILQVAQRNDDSIYTLGSVNYILATAALKEGIVVVGLPIPANIASKMQSIQISDRNYQALFRQRRQVRSLYMLLLLLTTSLALFACCWLALYLSKQVTRPVESLADAMEAIAAGNYAHRVGSSATEELGELVDSFNAMASDLESARTAAERSTTQLSELNAVLRARRTELETLIETIPNGVATLSSQGKIILANRAFLEMMDPGGQKRFVGTDLSQVFSTEIVEALDRLFRRAHRMGTASAEVSVQSALRTLQLSATVALLESGHAGSREHLGYVLVLEDVTQLLHAQKQSAWKEVARRVAHEIKNPLTPISLNAELIQRHVTRLAPTFSEHAIEPRSLEVIQHSTEIIIASVETMRSLVNQFSALAEFPSARPQPADLNQIVDSSLALFSGRMSNIHVTRDLAGHLPLVLADPEALTRALSNLIDNAAEAMHDSLLRELRISTRLLESGWVEMAVADTGPGVTDDMRERLFLPYFSTKQRGTGLGLSIAAKIIQEHHGTIRVEKNSPVGARFIIELRPASNHDGDGVDGASIDTPTEGAIV
jgi:two-component system nitrogen regulation sensor histidine kinase NtrY